MSRTVGTDKVVDEMIMNFTHDIPMQTSFRTCRQPVGPCGCRLSW